MSLFTDLGCLALGTRLLLVSDRLYNEVQKVYESCGVDFDSRNFLLFRTLMREEDTSVGALAQEVGFTHARVSQKLAELERNNLVEKIGSPDGRKSCFRLSAKSKRIMAKLAPIWSAIDTTLRNDLEGDRLLAELDRLEDRLNAFDLPSRVNDLLTETNHRTVDTGQLGFKILLPPFEKEVEAAFKKLNSGWLLENNFEIEPPDHDLFANLSAYADRTKGILLLAQMDDAIVGTALLIQRTAVEIELEKFCITPECRGRGIGRRLLALCELEAKIRKAKSIYLETNSKLESAVGLYRASGFAEVPPESSTFARADLCMRKILTTS